MADPKHDPSVARTRRWSCAVLCLASWALPACTAEDIFARTTQAAPDRRFALCSCESIVASAALRTGHAPGLQAGIGVHGNLDTSADLDVSGPLWIGGPLGLQGSGSAQTMTMQELRSAGPVRGDIMLHVTQDAAIAGEVQVAALRIDGTLTTPEGTRVDASTYEVHTRQSASITVPSPCDCTPERRFDVAAHVQAHRSDNDNALIGLDPQAIDGYQRDYALELPCGHFHLTRAAGSGDLRIRARGAVVLWIDGEVALDGGLYLRVDPQASLDVYVADNVRVSGPVQVEGEGDPAQVRLYVGGTGTLDLDAASGLGGGLYAPQAELVTRGPLQAVGPVFVRRLSAGGPIQIHLAEAPPAAICPP